MSILRKVHIVERPELAGKSFSELSEATLEHYYFAVQLKDGHLFLPSVAPKVPPFGVALPVVVLFYRAWRPRQKEAMLRRQPAIDCAGKKQFLVGSIS